MTEPQIIVHEGRPAFAVVPIDEWRRLTELAADIEDARTIEAVAADPELRRVPGKVVAALLDGTHPIRAWREHRGLSRAALAKLGGLTTGHVAHLETGRRAGTVDALQKVARALDVTIDDLVPVVPAAARPETDRTCEDIDLA